MRGFLGFFRIRCFCIRGYSKGGLVDLFLFVDLISSNNRITITSCILFGHMVVSKILLYLHLIFGCIKNTSISKNSGVRKAIFVLGFMNNRNGVRNLICRRRDFVINYPNVPYRIVKWLTIYLKSEQGQG